MRRMQIVCAMASVASFGAPMSTASADEEKKIPPEETKIPHEPEENDYGRKGIIEFGGSLSISWDPDLFTLGLSPSVGWFVHDRVELTGIVGLDYVNAKQADGSRTHSTVGSALFEPSYHIPVEKYRRVFVFGGLGVGIEYDGHNPQFDLVPRVGLNITIGRSGVFTPAFRVPILVGENQGAADDQIGVKWSLEFDAGFTTTF